MDGKLRPQLMPKYCKGGKNQFGGWLKTNLFVSNTNKCRWLEQSSPPSPKSSVACGVQLSCFDKYKSLHSVLSGEPKNVHFQDTGVKSGPPGPKKTFQFIPIRYAEKCIFLKNIVVILLQNTGTLDF